MNDNANYMAFSKYLSLGDNKSIEILLVLALSLGIYLTVKDWLLL